jgi:hypothetical protein
MRLLRIAIAIGVVSVMLTAPVSAAPPVQQWHRNNYNAGHERLTCRESAPTWTCSYESDVPDPEGTGRFTGRDVTAGWDCPEWFPDTICDNVVKVYEGQAVYFANGGPALTLRQAYVVTNVDGQPVLQLYWVDLFVCPWYRSFEEALAADFNCVFAPES